MTTQKKQIDLSTLSDADRNRVIVSALDSLSPSVKAIEIAALQVASTQAMWAVDAQEIRHTLELLGSDTYPGKNYQDLVTQLGFDYGFSVDFNLQTEATEGTSVVSKVLANVYKHSVDLPYIYQQLPITSEVASEYKKSRLDPDYRPFDNEVIWGSYRLVILEAMGIDLEQMTEDDEPTEDEIEAFISELPEGFFREMFKAQYEDSLT